jgi:hypothetical protein
MSAPEPEILTFPEVAARWRIEPRYVGRELTLHGVPFFGSKKKRRVRRDLLEEAERRGPLGAKQNNLYSAPGAEGATAGQGDDGRGTTADPQASGPHPSPNGAAPGNNKQHHRKVGAGRGRHKPNGRPPNSTNLHRKRKKED